MFILLFIFSHLAVHRDKSPRSSVGVAILPTAGSAPHSIFPPPFPRVRTYILYKAAAMLQRPLKVR